MQVNATMNLNPTLNGVEVRFNAKPEKTIIDSLKANGFRWSPRNTLWYARDSAQVREFAQKIATFDPDSKIEQAEVCKSPKKELTIEYSGYQGKKDTIRAGTILYTSWGYDQTNIEYYKVVEISSATKFVVQEIGIKSVEGSEGFMCDSVLPDDSKTTQPPRKAYLSKHGSLRLSGEEAYMMLFIFDGKSNRRSWYA